MATEGFGANDGSFKPDYRYTPDQCDVRSVEALELFRTKRDEWLFWLDHDEHHAISTQISAMLWSDAVFRLVNASRQHAHNAGDGFATQSGVLARALDRGYVAEQVIAFRKLMEPAANKPHRQVVSLQRLIDDVKAHRELLTREMFVCHDGLPFDDRCGLEDLPPPDKKGVRIAWVDTTGPRAFGMSNIQHRSFDAFMDSRPGEWSRDDVVGDKLFAEIDDTLAAAPFDELKRYANKLLLHAADPGSRGAAPLPAVTLDKIWSCHKAILKVANRISITIGGSNISAVPTPLYDVLEGWSAPFAPEHGFDDMLDEWRRENNEREDWCNELFT